jgi:hypothetical protein
MFGFKMKEATGDWRVLRDEPSGSKKKVGNFLSDY